MVISSKENETIKEIRKLKEKKYRTEKYIIEGIKMIEEAISEKQDIELIVVKEGFEFKEHLNNKGTRKNEYQNDKSTRKNEYLNEKEVIESENNLNFKIVTVTESVFNILTDVETPQGILAVVKKKENMTIDKNADYIVALDGIQDPGNLGTIIRTLDSANIKQIIVSKNTVDSYSPKVVRSTMGSIFRVNVIETDNLTETLNKLREDKFEIIVTSLDTDNSIYDINYAKKIVVIGNEANGVSKEIQEIADKKVKIPMLGKTESLNASVATGIMIYEYVRQNYVN